MNRQIKFRVWVHEDNKMQYPLVFSAGKDGSFVPLIECADGNRAYKPYPIMQFTGLTDKNGREIYEGDVIAHNGIKAYGNIEVSFIDGAFCIGKKGLGVNEFSSFCTIRDLMVQAAMHDTTLQIEVIGNIYQNHELL